MIDCPKCWHWHTEYYGVTDRGACKYICKKCYHKYEISYQLHKDWEEGIERMAEQIRDSIDQEIIQAVTEEIEKGE